jgi:type IV pilus assembly protein PilM
MDLPPIPPLRVSRPAHHLPPIDMPASLNFKLGRRSEADVVGLDIQPGLVAAVQVRVNGGIIAERGALTTLPSDTVREGDVVDEGVLAETLRELFAANKLSKRVRVGVANQRTVMRTLELPPVTDRKELAAAVRFQAQDQVPMPLANAVLDFHPLGIIDTPGGPRQRVVLVAAQRDMIERLLAAVRRAGLRAEGIDLSAFALIRSLYRHDEEHSGRVMYLNVDGLTNVAIAEGTVCRFTRVLGGGLEEMASEIAERRSIPLTDARALLAAFDLTAPVEPQVPAQPSLPAERQEATDQDATTDHVASVEHEEAEHDSAADYPGASILDPHSPVGPTEQVEAPVDPQAHDVGVQAPRDAETVLAEEASAELTPADASADHDVRTVLESGIREISGEVRNSMEFHRSQEGGGEVSRVVLSGAALDLPGFVETLQMYLGVEVHSESVGVIDAGLDGGVSGHRLAIATGLGAKEVPQ